VTRSQRLTLVATILASIVVFLDSTVANVALPAIARDLNTGLADQQWVIEAYLLTLTSLILVGGSLGDHFGRRRIFVLGLAGFGVTSALCAVAPSSETLIAARGLQGIAGAMLVPGSLAIVAATFDGADRGKAVGTWTAWTGISMVFGPTLGGALIAAFSWRAVFAINLPLIAITVALTRHAVAESRDPTAVRGFDVPGVVLSALGLGGPVFALIHEPGRGLGDPSVLVPLASGIVLFGAFLAREATARAPMLPLSLFRVRNFAAANASTLAVYAGLSGATFFITLFLQQVAGYSPLEAGLATTPISVVLFALSPRFGALSVRLGPRLPMSIGPITAGVGLLLLDRAGTTAPYVGTVLPAVLVFGLGLAATVAPLTATVLESVDEHTAGIASGVNNAVARVAGLLAIAIIGAFVAAHFDSALDGRLADRSLSARGEAVVAKAKSRPMAGAGMAAGLAPDERATVGGAIAHSSLDAFRLALAVGAGLLFAGGLAAAAGVESPHRRQRRRPVGAVLAGECARPGGEATAGSL
jgi:EmrB/QacA subfamily drug resistance transporter